jgi:hypothetical protein
MLIIIKFPVAMPEGTGSKFFTGMAAGFGVAQKGWSAASLAGLRLLINRIELP